MSSSSLFHLPLGPNTETTHFFRCNKNHRLGNIQKNEMGKIGFTSNLDIVEHAGSVCYDDNNKAIRDITNYFIAKKTEFYFGSNA
jgi:hypothetical protein